MRKFMEESPCDSELSKDKVVLYVLYDFAYYFFRLLSVFSRIKQKF